MTERWLPVAGYEGVYEVSDAGCVRSRDRKVWRTHHRTGASIARRQRGVLLRPQRHTGGYQIVTLWRDGDYRICLVHKLVLEAFIGPRPGGTQACHNDGDKTNNALTNLRWDTPRANQADRIAHGTRFGRTGSHYRVTPEIVAHVRARQGVATITSIARELGLPRTTVADVVNRRTHKGNTRWTTKAT